MEGGGAAACVYIVGRSVWGRRGVKEREVGRGGGEGWRGRQRGRGGREGGGDGGEGEVGRGKG
jgi:hypothetical protein